MQLPWGVPPTELVVAQALRQRLSEFLLTAANSCFFAKFVLDRQDHDTFERF